RYSYIPSAFLLCGAGLIISRFVKGSGMNHQAAFLRNGRYYWITLAAAACYMLYIIGYAIFYMPCWKDNYTLYLTICDHENPNFRGLAVLANLEYSKGNYASAIACSEAIQPKPWMPDIQKRAILLYRDYIKGMVCYSTGMKEDAMICFSRILASPEMPLLKIMIRESCREIIGSAGNYYIQQGKLKQAAGLFAMIPAVYPEEVGDCCFYRGLAAFLNGNLEAARAEFMAAHKIAPSDARITANLKRVEDLLREKAK
ncbi:MAG: tetratricopeptide repeat protein, partial [Victivallaceae bacterium]